MKRASTGAKIHPEPLMERIITTVQNRPIDFGGNFIFILWSAIAASHGVHATPPRFHVDQEGLELPPADFLTYNPL
jgi:hypothetical protein